jgi:hypothetical protein
VDLLFFLALAGAYMAIALGKCGVLANHSLSEIQNSFKLKNNISVVKLQDV